LIAVDTNLLVYAHRRDSSWHEQARRCLVELGESSKRWAIPWPCIHEFLAIVTHARIYDPPTPLSEAIKQVEVWLEAPSLTLLSESPEYWRDLRKVMSEARVAGPVVHDARIAALCVDHGVRVIWSADRDFGRFRNLEVRNPLKDASN
jgi:toxin-antitoxin system PIN domain toxin